MTSPVRAPRPAPRRPVAPGPGRRDHLRVVQPAPRARHRRSTPAVLAVALVMVFGSLMAAAIFHGLLVGGQADIDRIEREIEAKRADLARERVELARMQSPDAIAEKARALGLAPADEQHWLSPEADGPIVTGQAPVDTDGDGDPDATDPAPDDPTTTSEPDGSGGSTDGSELAGSTEVGAP